MSSTVRAALLASLILAPVSAKADQTFSSTLEGHVVIPAMTLVQPPADAPEDLRVSGRFTQSGRRADGVGTVPGKSGERETGLSVPFAGQPLQGFSGISRMEDGTFWVLTDNGFGSKLNSPDAMLFLHRWRVDFAAGTAERVETVFINDRDRKVPFRIANETTATRYLTGADFDPESIQPVADGFWIGEEFGPHLIRINSSGTVLGVHDTLVDGQPVRSPDHFAVVAPATPTTPVTTRVRRSRGFEGMALSPDGRYLYALLEGPLWDETTKDWEKADGREYLRILEFSTERNEWTGRFWRYPLEPGAQAIGDFNMIDAATALVIERDNGEGLPGPQACAEGQKGPTCWDNPAKLKRVYKIEMTDANAGGAVRKIGHIDLLAIADPAGRAKQGGAEGRFAFPFFTIENVDVVDAEHIVVGNDNNLPFSAAREPNRADDNELILLRAPEFLSAR
jgi:hypothetical protein